MAKKCVHKGCGKAFSDPEEDCVYHPGPPIFHEGQKGGLPATLSIDRHYGPTLTYQTLNRLEMLQTPSADL